MRCNHCGKEWADSPLQPMRFCPYCGQSLENSIPVSEPEPDPEPVQAEEPAESVPEEQPVQEEQSAQEPEKQVEECPPAEPEKPAVQEPVPVVYAEPVEVKDGSSEKGVLKACNTILILGIVSLAGNSLTSIGALIVAKIAEKKFAEASAKYSTLGKRAFIGKTLARIGKIVAIVSLIVAGAIIALCLLALIIAALVVLIKNT